MGDFSLMLVRELLEAEGDKRKIENLLESQVFLRFGRELGFKVLVVGDKGFTTAKELMRVFGYRRMDYVLRLLERHDVKTHSFKDLQMLAGQGAETFLHFDGKFESLVRQVFELSPHAPLDSMLFIDYRGFLVLGMYSQAENGDVVRNYLLEIEREFRRKAIEIYQGETIPLFERVRRYGDEIDKLIKAMGRTKDRKLRDKVAREIFKAVGIEIEGDESSQLRERVIKAIMSLENLRGLRIKGDYLWIETGRFMEILKSLGIKVGPRNVGKIRESLGFESSRTDTIRYTLIPVEHFPAEFLNKVGGGNS